MPLFGGGASFPSPWIWAGLVIALTNSNTRQSDVLEHPELAVLAFVFLKPSCRAVRKLATQLEEERPMCKRIKAPSLEQRWLPDEWVRPSWTSQLNVRAWWPQASPERAEESPSWAQNHLAQPQKSWGVTLFRGLPQRLSGKESACNAGASGDAGLIPGSGRSPGVGGYWQPTPVCLPGEFHGQRNLVGYSP